MINSKIKYKNKFYLITEEENYEDKLDFKEVFDEFREVFHILTPQDSFRDFSLGGIMLNMPYLEEEKTGVILPLTADDLKFDVGGTYNSQSIKIFLELAGGFILYFARRIEDDEKDNPIIACYLTNIAQKGDSVLSVTSTKGFAVGTKVRLFEGANGVVTVGEYIQIQTIGDKELTVAPIKKAYSKGACILEVDNV